MDASTKLGKVQAKITRLHGAIAEEKLILQTPHCGISNFLVQKLSNGFE